MQMLHFNFIDNEDFWMFYSEARRRSMYDIPLVAEHGDQLLSLITCSYTLYDGRLILMCRRLRPDEDPQEVAGAMQAATVR